MAAVKVFLDDERLPPPGWTRVMRPEEAVRLLESGEVTEISLDFDLGDRVPGTGDTVLRWVEEAVFERGFVPPPITIHTGNPSARKMMEDRVRRIENEVRRRSRRGESH